MGPILDPLGGRSVSTLPSRIAMLLLYNKNHFYNELLIMTSSQIVKKWNYFEVGKSSAGFNLTIKWHCYIKKFDSIKNYLHIVTFS